MEPLRGAKILVTGAAGQIAFPICEALARDNEVWGVARFSQRGSRERCERAGVRCVEVDLEDPEWKGLPDRVDYVLHLAVTMPPGLDYDHALRVNAEGTGLLFSRFRHARAAVSVSTCGVYASPKDPAEPLREDSPLGITSQVYSPTYPASKIGQEAVARFAAREFRLPVTIARMNVSYGANGGLPAYQLDALCAGEPIPVLAGRRSLCNPYHEDDIVASIPGLLAAASVPATILNWGGDEAVEVQEYCRYLGQLVGVEPRFVETPEAIHHFRLDPTRRLAATGPCRVPWREGMRRMAEARHPERVRRA